MKLSIKAMMRNIPSEVDMPLSRLQAAVVTGDGIAMSILAEDFLDPQTKTAHTRSCKHDGADIV